MVFATIILSKQFLWYHGLSWVWSWVPHKVTSAKFEFYEKIFEIAFFTWIRFTMYKVYYYVRTPYETISTPQYMKSAFYKPLITYIHYDTAKYFFSEILIHVRIFQNWWKLHLPSPFHKYRTNFTWSYKKYPKLIPPIYRNCLNSYQSFTICNEHKWHDIQWMHFIIVCSQ